MSPGIVNVVRALLILVLLFGASVDVELLHAHDPIGAPTVDCPACVAGSTTGSLPAAFVLPPPPAPLCAERHLAVRAAPALAPARRVSVRGPP